MEVDLNTLSPAKTVDARGSARVKIGLIFIK